MNHLHRSAVLLLILAFLFTISSCSLKYSPGNADDFRRETLRLEERARVHEDPRVRAESHRDLAYLYLNYRNPQLNYGHALREFEIYLEAAPEDRKSDEIQNWICALQELEKKGKEASGLQGRIRVMAWEREGQQQSLDQQGSRVQELLSAVERLQGRVETLEKDNRSLGEANRNLKEENEKVRDTLEKLRALDRQMEEKRRSIR